MNTVTLHINGCTVTVPADQEQLYREVLADKWIDGCRVYVENQDVMVELSEFVRKEGMSPETMRDLLLEEHEKLYALAGKL